MAHMDGEDGGEGGGDGEDEVSGDFVVLVEWEKEKESRELYFNYSSFWKYY